MVMYTSLGAGIGGREGGGEGGERVGAGETTPVQLPVVKCRSCVTRWFSASADLRKQVPRALRSKVYAAQSGRRTHIALQSSAVADATMPSVGRLKPAKSAR